MRGKKPKVLYEAPLSSAHDHCRGPKTVGPRPTRPLDSSRACWSWTTTTADGTEAVDEPAPAATSIFLALGAGGHYSLVFPELPPYPSQTCASEPHLVGNGQ